MIILACLLPAFGLVMLLFVGIFAPHNVVLTSISGVIVKLGTGLELGCATVFLADVVDSVNLSLEQKHYKTKCR